jgi:hypothetical protein
MTASEALYLLPLSENARNATDMRQIELGREGIYLAETRRNSHHIITF